MSEASVQVVVRVRPLNDREQKKDTTPVVTANTSSNEVTVLKGTGKAQTRNTFKFGNVFNTYTTQKDIFEQTLEPGAPPQPRRPPLLRRCSTAPAAAAAPPLALLSPVPR